LKGLLSVGVKICWGFGVAEVVMTHAGFVGSIEIRRSDELADAAAALRKNPNGKVPTPSLSGGQATEQNAPVHHLAHAEDSASVMLTCMTLLLCNNSVCDKDTFTAVVDSGLVFDGGLVVDTVGAMCFYFVYAHF
jgi:hypothetical protein